MSSLARRHVLVLGLVLTLVIAGCSGGGGGASPPTAEATGGGDGGDAAPEYEGTQAEAGSGGDGGGGENGGPAGDAAENRALQQRMRIRTGSVALEVESYADARDTLAEDVRRLGGFVSDSKRRRHREGNRSWETGRLVVRVPRSNFTDAMARIEGVGNVTRSSTNTKDVTDQLVDVEARLENLRAKRDRLRELYEQANETDSLLAIQERLSKTQGRIERLAAERKSLRNRVAFSTITIELAEPEPAPAPTTTTTATPSPAWHETGAGAAFGESVSGVATTLRAIVVLFAYAAPYLGAFGIPVALVYGVRRRSRNGGETVADDSTGES